MGGAAAPRSRCEPDRRERREGQRNGERTPVGRAGGRGHGAPVTQVRTAVRRGIRVEHLGVARPAWDADGVTLDPRAGEVEDAYDVAVAGGVPADERDHTVADGVVGYLLKRLG